MTATEFKELLESHGWHIGDGLGDHCSGEDDEAMLDSCEQILNMYSITEDRVVVREVASNLDMQKCFTCDRIFNPGDDIYHTAHHVYCKEHIPFKSGYIKFP